MELVGSTGYDDPDSFCSHALKFLTPPPAGGPPHPACGVCWILCVLLVAMLLGHGMGMRSQARTPSGLDSLAARLADEAGRCEGEDVVKIDPAELRVGDVVIVRPGGSVPADGTIVDGRADMDESMITGESHPVARGEGENVTAGTVATDSGLRVQITAPGDDTALAAITKLVSQAPGSSSPAPPTPHPAPPTLTSFPTAAVLPTPRCPPPFRLPYPDPDNKAETK